jgi:hypothetical protein
MEQFLETSHIITRRTDCDANGSPYTASLADHTAWQGRRVHEHCGRVQRVSHFGLAARIGHTQRRSQAVPWLRRCPRRDSWLGGRRNFRKILPRGARLATRSGAVGRGLALVYRTYCRPTQKLVAYQLLAYRMCRMCSTLRSLDSLKVLCFFFSRENQRTLPATVPAVLPSYTCYTAYTAARM